MAPQSSGHTPPHHVYDKAHECNEVSTSARNRASTLQVAGNTLRSHRTPNENIEPTATAENAKKLLTVSQNLTGL
jgi:hypothetical protein